MCVCVCVCVCVLYVCECAHVLVDENVNIMPWLKKILNFTVSLFSFTFLLQTSVPSFLGFLKLGEYEPLFRSEGYYTLDDVENLIGLNETHLRKMGITKQGNHSEWQPFLFCTF